MKKQINRKDLARHISKATGFTIRDVEEVLKYEDDIIAALISEGYEIKKHKLFKISLDTKKEKVAYDGLNKTYFTIPEKKILKIRPLSELQQAIDKLNETEAKEKDEKE